MYCRCEQRLFNVQGLHICQPDYQTFSPTKTMFLNTFTTHKILQNINIVIIMILFNTMQRLFFDKKI